MNWVGCLPRLLRENCPFTLSLGRPERGGRETGELSWPARNMATTSQRVAESKLLSAVNWFGICADRHLGLQPVSFLVAGVAGFSSFLSKHTFLSPVMQTQVGTVSALKYQPTITETGMASARLHDGSASSYGTSTFIWVFFYRKSCTQPARLDQVLWCTLLRQEAARTSRPA